MPGIYVMAIITLVIAAALWGGLLYRLSGRRWSSLWLLLPGLPLSALVNLGVKAPASVLVGGAAGVSGIPAGQMPVWFMVFLFLLAPVTEELIKLVPLLIPGIRTQVRDRGSAFRVGYALGVSFGLGEAAFLAYGVAHSPAYAGFPWYAFTGYLVERTLTCLAHGVFTAVFVMGLRQGGLRALGGGLLAMALHGMVNVGATLGAFGMIPAWAVQSMTLLAFVVVIAVFVGLWIYAGSEDSPQSRRERREEERGGDIVQR